MRADESTDYQRGFAVAGAVGILFQLGGGEPLTSGMRVTAFGPHGLGASDRLLRVGTLKGLLPSQGDERLVCRIRGSEDPMHALAHEIAEAIDGNDANRSRLLIGDWLYLRGFAAGLMRAGLIPTIEEQRLPETDESVAMLLCATQRPQEQEITR
jgi:hypothetical protein